MRLPALVRDRERSPDLISTVSLLKRDSSWMYWLILTFTPPSVLIDALFGALEAAMAGTAAIAPTTGTSASTRNNLRRGICSPLRGRLRCEPRQTASVQGASWVVERYRDTRLACGSVNRLFGGMPHNGASEVFAAQAAFSIASSSRPIVASSVAGFITTIA